MAINLLPLDATAGTPAFTAQQTRQALAALFGQAPSGRPLGASSGVRAGTPSTTVFMSGAGSTTWNVAAHAGALDTQTSALAGPYSYATTGGDSGAITAADATNPRVDIVYVKVNDNAQDGSGLTSGTIGYLAGTPAASPSAPATPARAMVLATIAVPKVGAGAPAATWVAPVLGQPSDAGDHALYVGGWLIQWGSRTVPIAASTITGTWTLTYRLPFAAAPTAFATAVFGATPAINAGVSTATTTQLTLGAMWNDNSAAHSAQTPTVDWVAIGPATA
jgi:hypothetical protein